MQPNCPTSSARLRRSFAQAAVTMLFAAICALPARAQAQGSIDTGYNPTIVGASVYAMAVQPDGKTIIGGGFTSVNGVARSYVARLNADGSLDTGFDPKANSVVYSVAVQADGKRTMRAQRIEIFGGF